MGKFNSSRGSAAVPALLAVILQLFVGVTLYYFVAQVYWFPPPINDFGRDVDAQFTRTFIITGIVFVLSQVALAWVVFRYRDRGGRASPSHGNNTLEVLWTGATLVLFIGLGLAAQKSWAQLHFIGAPPGSMEIEVTGKQFNWYFRYPGADGAFGRSGAQFVTEANPAGLDDKDPAGKDDVVTATLGIPQGRSIKLVLRSFDVTHGFYVRELRLKQDALPGMLIPIHFQADVAGDYEIVCTQLCGNNHHRMRAVLKVLPQADFEKWLANEKATE
jgi:cytochrome c oxidase subunit 2